jgi:hypothetical protein
MVKSIHPKKKQPVAAFLSFKYYSRFNPPSDTGTVSGVSGNI